MVCSDLVSFAPASSWVPPPQELFKLDWWGALCSLNTKLHSQRVILSGVELSVKERERAEQKATEHREVGISDG